MFEIDIHKIDGNVSRETIYNISDFPYDKFKYSAKIRKGGKHRCNYYDLVGAFDIETTTIKNVEKPYGFMYIWQFCLEECVCMGRTWEEFIYFIEQLNKTLMLCKTNRLVVYVHFLSYEFQFIHNFLQIDELFAKDKRKPLYFYANGIEWRCSYFLSNMSLAKFCENSELCTYYKKDGDEFDYSKIRTPKTELTKYEYEYCYCDVRGLVQCIRSLLQDDTIVSIPLTNTGYVRRYFRNEMKKNPKNRYNFLDMKLTPEQYLLCKKIFRGGNTHASRFYADMILENVASKDEQSSYPACMMLDYFPVSKFMSCSLNNLESFEKYINKYCVIMTVDFYNIELSDDEPIPYIDIGHCEKHSKIINDNGRVLKADFIRISITEIDFNIIKKQYKFSEFSVLTAFFAKRGKLPKEFRKALMFWYSKKTELKGVEGSEYEYMKSKNRVNSSFGMMVSNIVHDEFIFDGVEWDCEKADTEKGLTDFYENRNNFLSYQQGIYVTAHARRRLQVGIDILKDDLIYTDTDSLKYLNPEKYEEIFSKINAEIIADCEKSDIPAYAVKDGKKYYLGIFDTEPTYTEFKTLGAKKYCGSHFNKKGKEVFEVTVSGMSKEKGSIAVGSCDNFLIGSTYENVGRTVSYYNDYSAPFKITVNGDTFTTASNIGVVETTYTLGVTNEYWERIVENIDKLQI